MGHGGGVLASLLRPLQPPGPFCLEAHFLPSLASQLVLKPPLKTVRQGASGGAGDSEMRSGRRAWGEQGAILEALQTPHSPRFGFGDSRAGRGAQRDP